MKHTKTWYSVRTVVTLPEEGVDQYENRYEERITIWLKNSFDEAMEAAQRESREYADTLGGTPTTIVQAFIMDGPPTNGAEVYSLMRDSSLEPDDYIDKFFDTGKERETKS